MTTFAYDNIMTRETTNLSLLVGDVNASYPLANMQHLHLSKAYRSVNGTLTVEILIDAGEPVEAEAFMLRSQDGFGISSMTLDGNTADSWGSPAFTQSITNINNTYLFGSEIFSAAQTYRYWRLSVTSVGSFVKLENIYLGPVVSGLDSQGLNQGWTHVNQDTSNVQISEQGQRYIHQKPDIAALNATMSLMDESETTAIDNAFEYCGVRRPIWIIPTIDNAIKYSNQYFFTARPVWKQDRYRLHSTSLSFVEAK